MNQIRHTLAVIVFLVSGSAWADTLTIRADEWFPMNGDPFSEQPGYMIELAEVILAPHGHTVEYRTMPWERSLTMVREGKFDCVVGAYIDDAPDFVFPEQEWGINKSTFYVKQGESWRYTGIESLRDIKIGTIGSYAYSDEFDAYVEANKQSSKVQVLKANNALEQNIKKVLAGRITATVESDLVMEAKLKEMGLQGQLVPAGLLSDGDAMYIACSPAKESSKHYVKLFSEGVEALRQSGQLKTILEKYGLVDWRAGSTKP
ncbi:MAG: transporter substrate-binding domain-containing protein [Oleiphilaceae bacterium]|nr:transporter substrate-binding domain-containing protein [Oleiphilaceae bacterium]